MGEASSSDGEQGTIEQEAKRPGRFSPSPAEEKQGLCVTELRKAGLYMGCSPGRCSERHIMAVMCRTAAWSKHGMLVL